MERRITRWLPLLCALGLLAGCAGGAAQRETQVSVYYIVNLDLVPPEQREVFQTVETQVSKTEGTPKQLLQLLLAPPGEMAVSPFPDGTIIQSCVVEAGRLHLDCSEAYNTLTGYDQTLSAYAIALTMVQLADISEVSLTVDGAPLPGRTQTVLRQEDALCTDYMPEQTSIEVALYYWNPEQSALRAEYRTLTAGEDVRLATQIVQALIDGTAEKTLRPLLPPETVLERLSITDGCCEITLSLPFWAGAPAEPLMQEITLRSIVKSLTNLDFITSVRILPPMGSGITTYGSVSVTETFS